MTEKTVEIEVAEKPSVVVVLKTQSGNARLKFKSLKQNQLSKLQIDLGKDLQLGLSEILKTVLSVDNLIDDGESVSLEQIHEGAITSELAAAIYQGFFGALNAKNEEVVDPKKESAAIDLAAA